MIVFFPVILSFVAAACTSPGPGDESRVSPIVEQLVTGETDAETFDFTVLYDQPIALAELNQHFASVKARNQNPLYNVGTRTLTQWCQFTSQEITIEIALQLIAQNDRAEDYRVKRAEIDSFLEDFYFTKLPERISVTNWQDTAQIRAAIASEHERDQLMDQMLFGIPSVDRQVIYDRFGYDIIVPTFEKQDCIRYREATPFITEVLNNVGWPGTSIYGEETQSMFRRLVQHNDHNPDLQKRALELLKQAVLQSDAKKSIEVFLDDRVSRNEMQPQRYGTQLQFNDDGCSPAYGLIEPETVDERRAEAGLDSLAEYYATVPGCEAGAR